MFGISRIEKNARKYILSLILIIIMPRRKSRREVNESFKFNFFFGMGENLSVKDILVLSPEFSGCVYENADSWLR